MMILKLIGGFFVCLWAADFVTGMAHWLEDTYCLENYPLIGSFICEPNIEHHVDPQLMVREGTSYPAIYCNGPSAGQSTRGFGLSAWAGSLRSQYCCRLLSATRAIAGITCRRQTDSYRS